MARFCYQEIWQKRWKAWRRVLPEKIPGILEEEIEKSGLYQTPQFFSSLTKVEGEEHFLHPYFDFDSPSLDVALHDAKKLAQFARSTGFGDADQRWNFSGRKGFHCVLNGYLAGIEPSAHLTAIMKIAAGHLRELLEIETLDMSVYTMPRMLRIPGTMHESTGRRAITIGVESLLSKGMEEILAASMKNVEPNPFWRLFEPCEAEPDPEGWWNCYVDQHAMHQKLSGSRRATLKAFGEGRPLCVKALQDDGIKGLSVGRNEATFVYALALKAGSVSQEEAESILETWTEGVHFDETGEAPPPRRVARNALSTIRSVYQNQDRYHSCSFARSIGCQCDHDACQYVQRPAQQEEARRVSLDEAVDSGNAGVNIEIEGIVIGRDRTPILLPAEARVWCRPEAQNLTCQNCTLFNSGQKIVSIYHQLWAAMPMAMSNREKREKLFRDMADVPKDCPGCNVQLLKKGNMTFAAIQPDVHANLNGHQVWRENDVAVLSSSIEDQNVYSFIGQTHEHPKTSRAVTVARSFRRKNLDIDTFKLKDEDIRSLEVFQAENGKAWEKLEEIHAEWEEHVHGIYGRRLQAIGLSLAWFSPLSFRLRNRDVSRGWLEVLALGDTSQGKTHLATAFQRHMDSGYFISGENLSVAGLIAGVDKVNGQYVYRLGALPRNDRRLVIFEEFGAAKEDTKRSLSDVRSSGLARLNKIISLSVPARCRKVILANPIKGKHSVWMSSQAFPIEHVLSVMGDSPEDVRRLDLVVGLADSDAIREEIHRRRPEIAGEPVFTSKLSKLLCLWMFSLKPNQIQFTPDALEEIDALAEGLSNEYCREIPLWDPGDSRNKVARLACSIAGITFSTRDGRDLLVRRDHVLAVSDLVYGLYQGPDLGFLPYSILRNENQKLTREILNDASLALASSRSKAALEFFSHNPVVQQRDFIHACDMTEPEVNRLLNEMRRKFMIVRKGVGFELTPRGVQITKAILAFIRDHDGAWPHGVIPDERFKVTTDYDD